MAQLIVSIIVAVTIMHVFLLGTAYLILLERKIASWAQDRIGPNRVGPQGLLQPIADGLKFLMKEDYNPGNVDRALFMLAPVMAVIPALVAWAVIPWGGIIEFPGYTFPESVPLLGGVVIAPFSAAVAVADINVGVIFILAIGSLAVYGITVGAWASNNKYAFLGGLRATAQMLSYEIPMGLCVLVILLMAGTAHAEYITESQVGYWFGIIPSWNIFQQPIAAVVFFTCSLAESNRAPFDLAECEQELIGGFHTEYSSMKFAMFFLGEYMHMATAGAFFSVLFLGGWHMPWIDLLIWGGPQPAVAGGSADLLGIGLMLLATTLKLAVFLGKVTVIIAIMMWIRWTLPRFRFDQLMRLAWRALIPITIILLLATGVMVYYQATGWMWLVNIVLAVFFLAVGPLLPDPSPVNRRVPLEGSRFSPLPAE